jgi:hypothetical protein
VEAVAVGFVALMTLFMFLYVCAIQENAKWALDLLIILCLLIIIGMFGTAIFSHFYHGGTW